MDIFGTDYDTLDGTCVRDFIHVTDLVDAHAALLRHLRGEGPSVTLNCGYGRGYSVRQVVEAVRQVSTVNFPVRELPRRPGDPASVVADSTKLRELLGWSPKHDDLQTIVRAAYNWEQYLSTRADRPEVA
jgi:UDP-glucose 4-epimerase